MNYNINLGGWNRIFAVPSDVVDKYIKIASGSNIKVLLYFLRHCGELLNDEIIATALSMNEEDVKDALSFWVQVGLLTMSDGVYSPMQAVPEAARPQEKEPVTSGVSASVTVPAGVTAKDAEFAAVKAAALRSPEFSPAEIADTIKSDDKIDFLFKTCETLYGRPLKHTEQNAIITITEHIGLSAEVVLMMVDYCFSINKSSPAYLKETAMNWMENGITDLASAERQISMLQAKNVAESSVKSMFGINRALTQKEKDFVNLWFNVWNFDSEMVKLAYEINVNAKGQFAFPYISKILENWHSKGIATAEQVKDENIKRQEQQSSNSSFDVNKIDELLLQDYE